MPNLRGSLRIVLAVVLLVVIGLTMYQIGVSVWANHQYNSACEALERYDFDQASSYLDRYLSLRPNNPDVRFLAAQVARRRGNFDEALRLLTRARS